MNLAFTIILGVVGLIIGFLIPEISNRIIKYKVEQKNLEFRTSYPENILLNVVFCIFNGAVWAAAGVYMDNSLAVFLFSILITLACVFAIIDIHIHRIPNELLVITLIAGGLFQIILYGGKAFLIALACMLAMTVLFTIVGVFVGMEKVGAGDVKLAGVMGMVLGYPHILTGILFMSLAFVVYSGLGMCLKKLTLFSMLPFAPFMMLGMVASLVSVLWLG